ncbi:putative quinol monooxygenase [Puniceibacterium confluentis]|uniref:putative quinol monooxygenase n=1 Tax=Puniceibacterium confluentis TaxID=1958944 RepID=UPI0011B6F191|nr:putative quinol monooxygenase [Puniceibacterium confluentis]
MIHLTGTLTCAPQDRQTVRDALPAHIRHTRAEPGCLEFEVVETRPGVFAVSELFVDRAAYEVHQTRTKASDWFTATVGMTRDYTVSEV